MRRREFIKVIVGSAGWPLAVHAHRKRLARDAIGLLVNNSGTSIHAPQQKVRVRTPKTK